MFTQGVNGKVVMNDCVASNNPKNHATSLLRWAQQAGKSTGLITNTRVTHATPAAAYAHSSNRLYESDNEIHMLDADPDVCVDIARQMMEYETGKNLNVILGGGRTKFLPNTTTDGYGNAGSRHDGRNLINEWKQQKKDIGANLSYVTDRSGLLNVDYHNTEYLLGLFAPEHMKYHADADHNIEPTLKEMTQMGINVLEKNPNGFVLFVESGLIDYANHATLAQKAVIEVVELDETVEMARSVTSTQDTLILVSSDHSHTMVTTIILSSIKKIRKIDDFFRL